MKISKQFILQFLSQSVENEFELDDFKVAISEYKKTKDRHNMIASTIQSVFEDYSQTKSFYELIDSMCEEEYFNTIVPKLSFGRQKGHTTALSLFIKNNPSLNVVVITPTTSMSRYVADNIYDTIGNNVDNVSIYSSSNPSSIRVIDRKTDVIIFDELPSLTSVFRSGIYTIASIAKSRRIPLIVLGGTL